jgi:single-stranded DNA-binding protein
VDAFIAKYLHKGDRVFVSGTLNERTFQGTDGPKSIWEITGDKIMSLTPKEGSGGGGSQPSTAPEVNDDEIPF